MLRTGFRNQIYDDALPLYIQVSSGMVMNRLTREQVTLESLQDAMDREGYEMQPGEVDHSYAYEGWEDANPGWWSFDSEVEAPPVGPSGPAISATVPTSLPSQTAVVQIGVDTANLVDGTQVALDVSVDEEPGFGVSTTVQTGDTAGSILTRLQSNPAWGVHGVTATVTGSSLTIDAGVGSLITDLTTSVLESP